MLFAHEILEFLLPIGDYKIITSLRLCFSSFQQLNSYQLTLVVKEQKDSEEVKIELEKKKFPFNKPPKELPKQLFPAGLSLKRQWYLYDQIRCHIPSENDKNQTCPLPKKPKSDIEK